MEKIKEFLLDVRFIVSCLSFTFISIVALLRWIIVRTLKHYDEEHKENREEHRTMFTKLEKVNIDLTRLEDKLQKEE